MNLKTFLRVIKRHKAFLISTHVHPDADGLCSELALSCYLKSLGKKVHIINAEKLPAIYSYLPQRSLIQKLPPVSLHYDVAIVLDSGDLQRIGAVKDILKKEKILINIDHHVTNHHFGDINIVDPHASSTAEVLFTLFKKAKFEITKTVANLLYLGIMTDTGSFRYENTTAYCHNIVSQLMRFDIPVQRWYQKVYEDIALEDYRMLHELLKDFQLSHGNQVVSLEIYSKTLKKFSGMFDLRDRIFTSLRILKKPYVFVIFTQIEKDRTRVNFRSRRKVNVAKLAALYKGGGHKRASGCWLKTDIRQAKRIIFKELEKTLS